MPIDTEKNESRSTLDLSRLEALKLPEETVEIKIGAEMQKVTVTAHDDTVLIIISEIMKNHPEDGELRVRRLLLTGCAGLTQEQAETLLRYDGRAAAELIQKIFELTAKFNSERDRMREQAEAPKQDAEPAAPAQA